MTPRISKWWIVAATLTACQPTTTDSGDALTALEDAMAALEETVDAHEQRIVAAAGATEIDSEETAFAADAAASFEAALHATEELEACTGEGEMTMSTDDIHEMFVQLEQDFIGHGDEVRGATDPVVTEQAFHEAVETHVGHGMTMHDELHEHAESGAMSCEADAHND